MSDALIFPPGFLWGTATSAYQVEGGIARSDWNEWESRADTNCVEPSGTACDHRTRYPQDLALLSSLGFNSYRFSLEWSRIEPEEGTFLTREIDHYLRVIETCRAEGLEPVVTLNHFTLPAWLGHKGAWEHTEAPALFARFCDRVMQRLGGEVTLVCTLNEPNIVALLGYLNGTFPPGKTDPSAREVATMRLLEAHTRARDVIKARSSDTVVGLALAMADWQVIPGGERHLQGLRELREDVFLEAARDDDFLGVNTYTRHRVGPEGFMATEEGVEQTMMGYEFWPDALEATLRRAWEGTQGTTLIVTESGIGTADDTRRIAYVRRALGGVHACLRGGIDVRGYFYWSSFDNFEWDHGYGPTFGLIAVDRETQARSPKPSAAWLGSIARANALSPPAGTAAERRAGSPGDILR